MVCVVKIGGSLISGGALETILDDIPSAMREERIVIVHGGGQMVTEVAEKLGKKQRFVTSPKGVQSRYTDSDTAEIYSMVMSGLISARIVSGLSKRGVRAFGISGLDGPCITAERKKRLVIIDERGRKMAIEGGFTGKISEVDGGILRRVVEMGLLPVVSPVAMSTESEILNVDSDRAASAIAAAIPADQLVFMTNVPGLTLDGKLVTRLKASEAEAMLPRIGTGMDKKVIGAIDAVRKGVPVCKIVQGSARGSVTAALAGEGGTVIVDG